MCELNIDIRCVEAEFDVMAQILFAGIFAFARMLVGPCITYITLSADYPLLIKV